VIANGVSLDGIDDEAFAHSVARSYRAWSRDSISAFVILLLLGGVPRATRFVRDNVFVAAVCCGRPIDDPELLQRTQAPGFSQRLHDVVNKFDTVDKQLRKHKLQLINPRATEICIGMQPIGLPALLTLMIIDEACPLAFWVTDYLKWKCITAVKHFHDRRGGVSCAKL
jgi:hypothetical protein